jgi:hypothetical protein
MNFIEKSSSYSENGDIAESKKPVVSHTLPLHFLLNI